MRAKKKEDDVKPDAVVETETAEVLTQEAPPRRLSGDELKTRLREERRAKRLAEKGY